MHLDLIYDGHLKDEREIKAIITLFLFALIRFRDSSYAGNLEDRKSVMGYYYFIKRAILFWWSKNQRLVSISTTKAKYIAFGHAIWETIWLRRFINKLQVFEPINYITLHKDNKISIMLTKNTESQYQIKYIDIQHWYIQELMDKRELELSWICSSSILADKFTKALSIDIFY